MVPLVFRTFVSHQGVDGLINILSMTRQTSSKKGRICEPVINLDKTDAFLIGQLQAVEQSIQNLSFRRLHSLVPLFSGCNFSFYIVTNCLAIILFQFLDCSLFSLPFLP